MSEKIPLIRELPFYTEKATGYRVQALEIMFITGSPRGCLIIPKNQRYAAFEVATGWIEAQDAKDGDFVVWQPGQPVRTMRPDAFDAEYRPTAE